ncbi:MAG: redox-regulated ATPase YchF [Candidatus Aenigmatarchaeota archaeon]
MMIIGICGKTNVGKSSFFKAATLIDVEIANRRFVTINPNVGIGYVITDCVCKEFGVKCNPKNSICKNGKRFIPIKLVDVAGLIPGAHAGKGLGNKFLDDLRQASAFIHIVDASGLTDAEGNPTQGYDPSFDVEFVKEEIELWFADVIKRALTKIGKAGSKAELVQMLAEQLSGLEVNKKQIEAVLEKVWISDVDKFAREIRKISKPMLIAANKIDLPEAQKNFELLKEKFKDLIIIPTSADYEIALRKAAEAGLIDYLPGDGFKVLDESKLSETQKKALEKIKALIEKYGSTGVQDCLNKAVFDLLGYIVVYPVEDENKLCDKHGNVLPDALLMPKGSTALDLAFKIHTEIGEKFICAVDARSKRRLGKDYILQNNDVIRIMVAK